MSDLRGLDPERTTDWLVANTDLVGPLDITLIAAGGSNLTFRVVDGEGSCVALRRPPAGTRLQSAHDIDREWTILTRLASEDAVPTPAPIARCDDESVTGAAFYVMDFVDGAVYRSSADTADLSADEARAASRSLVDVQVALHALALDEIGLAGLGRHDGYVGRQLRRWSRQVDAAGVRRLAVMDEVRERLERDIPPELAAPALVHGDYRFDNTVVGEDHRVRAVLDWELATTGDPIADLAWSLQYWASPDDPLSFLPDPPTAHDTFPDRRWVIDTYRRASGTDLTHLDYYVAFSWWKQAAIVEGVYARRLAGVRGGMADDGDGEAIGARAEEMFDHAHELVCLL